MENSVTSDIDIEEALAKIQIPENLSVRVGILDGATNEQGDLIAPYAAANELGATIHVPEQQRDMNFKIAKDGKSRFSTLSKANFQENVTVPAHTVVIPPRPFLRSTVAEKGKNWAQALKFEIVQQGITADSVKLALTAVGEMAANDVRSTIQKGVNPANAPSTIKQKQRRGNADPEHTLVNTGSMQAAISYGVDDES
ncbi:hypothetical protein LMG33818_000046 [Halomonadaceae bacterium LMG 33818]|uniref:hypothetical protein n=1 Tax=Cernens ardua TaxID=3402176 RepID=UPI003EDB9400